MRRIPVLALVAVLALMTSLTACGSDSEEPEVATLNGTDNDGGDGSENGEETGDEKDLEEQALEFAECMRENGVPDFPDPEVEDGRIQMRLGGPDGGGELDQEAVEQAMQACEDLAPRGGGNFSSEERQEMQDAILEYAQCMRDNGYDMPDPDFESGDGLFRMQGEPDDPAFQQAQEACEDKLPGRPGEDR
jgi:hypothetical protein